MARKARLVLVLAALAVCFAASTSVASASYTSMVNGDINFVTKTVTVDYAEPIVWEGPFSTSAFKNGLIADVYFNGTKQTVGDSSLANTLATTSFTHATNVRVVVPSKDIDISGRAYPRHFLAQPTISGTLKMNFPLTINGTLLPSHPNGSKEVVTTIWKLDGSTWKTFKTLKVTNDSDTGYHQGIQLPAGRYKVGSTVLADDQNAAVDSPVSYFSVASYRQYPKYGYASMDAPYVYKWGNAKSRITVLDQYKMPIKGAKVTFTWRFGSRVTSSTSYTDAYGKAVSTRNARTTKSGTVVPVSIKVTNNGSTIYRTVRFTVR